MNRRGFLGAFGVMAAAALTLDPEKLLWRPEAKTIFIPKLGPTVVVESTADGYYGWVQTQGICNVLMGNKPAIDLTLPQVQDLMKNDVAHIELFRGNSQKFVFVKSCELIKRGSVVTWRDHCRDEIRVAQAGDFPIGVKL